MQQVPHESVFDIVLDAFDLQKDISNRQHVGLLLTVLPSAMISDTFKTNLQYLSASSSSKFKPSSEVLNHPEFQNWIFDTNKSPEKLAVSLHGRGIKLNSSLLFKAIKNRLSLEFIEFLTQAICPIPFSKYLECLLLLEFQKQDKKNKSWAQKTQVLLLENFERFAVADEQDIHQQVCFHQNENYFSVQKKQELEIFHLDPKSGRIESAVFFGDNFSKLFGKQSTLSILQQAFYFELPYPILLRMLSQKTLSENLNIFALEIIEQLKTKPAYFEHLNTNFQITESMTLKEHLSHQEKHKIDSVVLVKHFENPSFFWNQTLKKKTKLIPSDYQLIWKQIEKNDVVDQSLKEQLQTLINFPQNNAMHFEEWLFYHTNISHSLIILNKWEIILCHQDSNPNNLFLLGIYHKRSLAYFRYLIEKLNYTIYIGDYYSALACLNTYIAQDVHEEWIAPFWEYLTKKGSTFIKTAGKTHFSYHFNQEENALLIVTEFAQQPNVQLIYLDPKKGIQHQEYSIKDYHQLKQLNFKYFFESVFVIEQVNPQVILQSIYQFLEQEKQLDFMKKLLSLIQNKIFLKDYSEYDVLLQQPLTFTYKEQQLDNTLEEYLKHRIKRELFLGKKWLRLIEHAHKHFDVKLSVCEEKNIDDHQTTLKDYLSDEPLKLNRNINPFFKEWLFESANAFEKILALIDRKFLIDDHYSHEISSIGLAVLNHYPLNFIQKLIEDKSLKLTCLDFLQTMAFLEIFSKDIMTEQWALEVKQYLISILYSVVLVEDFPSEAGYLFYNDDESFVLYDGMRDIHSIIEKNPQQPGLKRSFFKLNYSSDKQIIFDSPLQLAIKLQMPCDFIDFLITHKQIKEKNSVPNKHVYYELLKLEESSPQYFQSVLTLLVNKFSIFDPDNNNLLHFLALQDRPDLIAKHDDMLLPFISQVNRFGNTPVTQAINCSKETFRCLMQMQASVTPEPNQLYQWFVNPKYTEILLNTFDDSCFSQKLTSGLSIIDELFNFHVNVLEICKIILSEKPDFFDGRDKDHLLLSCIHSDISLTQFNNLSQLLSFDKSFFGLAHFQKACELHNWEIASHLFKIELFQGHFSEMIQNPAILDFWVRKNLINHYPILLDSISAVLASLPAPYPKQILKQILSLAKSQKQWIHEFKDFPNLLLLGLQLELIQTNELYKGGEQLLYFVEQYAHQHEDDGLLMKIIQKPYKVDFNKKNAAQEHILFSIVKQESGLFRLQRFLSYCEESKLQLHKLNAQGENLLDIMLGSFSPPFIEFCFNKFGLQLTAFIEEDLRKKTSKIIGLLKKDPDYFSFFTSYFKAEHWHKLQQLSEAKERSDLKKYLLSHHAEKLSLEIKETQINWQDFKSFLTHANPKQILNLSTVFKMETLPKLLVEHSVTELFLILKDKPAACMKELCKFKAIIIHLQLVADYCYLTEDEDLLKKLQTSLPKEITLKSRLISDWSSLKKLLNDDINLTFKLLDNQKLEDLLSRHDVLDLYLGILEIDIGYLKNLHAYPAIQKRIPEILRVCHENHIIPILNVIYEFIPDEYRAHERLLTLAHTAHVRGNPQEACNANSLRALSLFSTGDTKVALELQRKAPPPKTVYIEQQKLPVALLQLYHLITPFLDIKHPYLGLYGSSIRHFYNQKFHVSDYDCFAVLTCELESIFQMLRAQKFGHVIFINCANPIIRITVGSKEQSTEIDLSRFHLNPEREPHLAIEEELEKHDFTISGAYALINENPSYPICGSEKSLLALNEKRLGLMQPTRLQEDPLRLMRAVKLQLDDDSYQADEALTEIIESRQPQQALSDFLNDELHCKQFVTQLNKVLKNPDQQLMTFELMDKYHFFETWTGFKFSEIKPHLENLPAIDARRLKACQLKFIKYLYILTSLKQSSLKDLESTVIYKVTRGFSPAERMFFELIDNKLYGGKSLDSFIDESDTLELIAHAKKS